MKRLKMTKIKCMECGELVYPTQTHTYNDCLKYKAKIALNNIGNSDRSEK